MLDLQMERIVYDKVLDYLYRNFNLAFWEITCLQQLDFSDMR